MIIREQEIVVGMLDDSSLKLTESTSAKLDELVKDWRENGVILTQAEEGELADGVASNDSSVPVPFTADNLPIFELELWKAGFHVQTA